MKLEHQILKKAKLLDKTIILPEAHLDSRIMEAAYHIMHTHLSKIIVFGKETDYPKHFLEHPLVTHIDTENYADFEKMAKELYKIRKEKGLTLAQAKKLLKNEVYFACMLVHMGIGHGIVCGAHFTTAQTLKPALQIIKTAPNKHKVCGCMILTRHKSPQTLLLADVSLNEDPNSDDLSEFAIGSAEFMQKLGIEPKVALLSYSTKGSAESDMVAKMAKAYALAKHKMPELKVDGEMQADSALCPDVAHKKGITSEVGGNANVLIFPDLNAGNIGYKLCQRLAGYKAIGPIMINFNKPVNDLSRGCSSEEIVLNVAITKIQATE